MQQYKLQYKMRQLIRRDLFKFTTAKEWLDDPHQITQKVKQLATYITKSKHPILFTGAGISTSVGIPDYRSGQSTIVPTGTGIWNRKQQSIPPKLRIDQTVDLAVPSTTHMAIKTLIEKQVFKYLVSQNTDGLHLRSGVHFSQIAELHGNRNLQRCINCKRKYFRDFRTIKRGPKQEGNVSHLTGRQCQNCGGDLIDSIIYFGQKLPLEDLSNALRQAAMCDLLLCIGSSLTVKPSANVPIIASKQNATICIINIQQTPFDTVATLKINGFCDEIMSQLMQELKIPIDQFVVQHFLSLSVCNNKMLTIEGKDRKGMNFTFIKMAKYAYKQYQAKGHQIQIPFIEDQHELQIYFYGNKSPLSLYLPSYYKLHHGENVRLKIYKANNNEQWNCIQI